MCAPSVQVPVGVPAIRWIVADIGIEVEVIKNTSDQTRRLEFCCPQEDMLTVANENAEPSRPKFK
jgi:hypothetical protein